MIPQPDWYDLVYLPRGKALVRVRRGGYVVAAATDVDRRGVRHWHEVRGRTLEPLAWEPTGWQPMDASKWTWPNGAEPPLALPVYVYPRMASIGGVAFDAVASSEELEADRQAAMATRGQEPREVASQWWRDVSRVVYEPMGSVSREMGEARIMRALIVERSLRMDINRKCRTNAAVLADLKRTLADVLAEEPDADWVPRLHPMPEDWRDFDIVMGWLVEVSPAWRELSVLRARMLAPPWTWVQIGDWIGREPVATKKMFESTIEDLVAAGNREARRAHARLASLQARNREAKRA